MNPIAKALNIRSDMERLKTFQGTVVDENGQVQNDSDYEYCRAQYKKIIDGSNEVIAELMQLAMASEDSKKYEALSKLIDSITKSTEALASLNIQRDMIQAREEKPVEMKTHVKFRGNMADLKRLISGDITELEIE